MPTKRMPFPGRWLPYALLAPQVIVTLIFFIWPSLQALYMSLLREDAFGLSSTFVGLANFARLFADDTYLGALSVTAVFASGTALLSMAAALLLAATVNRMLRSRNAYTTLLVWPYAIAPAIAGVLWWFIFNPSIGIVPYALEMLGYRWNHRTSGADAMMLVIIAAAWKQIAYNFLFFLAGLQSTPPSPTEAAAIPGAGTCRGRRRARRSQNRGRSTRPLAWSSRSSSVVMRKPDTTKKTSTPRKPPGRTIVFPLLSPTTFFLMVVNLVYAMFDTFGVIHATTQGGASQATNTLVYKVYADGFVGMNLGSSAAQLVVLRAIVIALTVVQFRYIERRVNY